MSRTTIIHVYPNEKIECGEELYNSWGSAPYIWDYLVKKYIDPNGYALSYNNTEALWKLWNNLDVPTHQRAVLMLTFDCCYVLKRDYWRMASDIRAFLENYDNQEVVNHWHRIAEIFASNPDIPAIGLWCTSVSRNPFVNNGFNEETEEENPPDWTRCWDIYEQLDAVASSI